MGRIITLDLALEPLLTQIAQKAAEIIQADRCSVFIYEAKTDELWSTVALGLKDQTIRIPAGTGLAGAGFQSGQPINLAEVYQNSRHLVQKEDLCPGKISLCRFCFGPEDCLANGGSLFTLTFSVPEVEFESPAETSESLGAL